MIYIVKNKIYIIIYFWRNKISKRERRIFTEDFKLQMVLLYNNGKSPSEILKEYNLTRSL